MNSIAVTLAQNSASRPLSSARVYTFGCKVNTYESELIAQTLGKGRWRLVEPGQAADVHIINTCTVTREADRQARQMVRRIVRLNPNAVVVVTGCYAQMDPQACAAIPGVDFVVGNARKLDIPELLPELLAKHLPPVLVADLDEQVTLPQALLSGYDGLTRAYVQIQQGCNQGCTFCIIHRARGRSRSLPMDHLIRQVQRLVMNDYREIVLCGVDLGDYGSDTGGTTNLLALLRSLVQIEGDFQIRLGSLDPVHMHDELLDFISTNKKMCPHLHLSLQSGSTLILKRMKRRYSSEFVYERVDYLRKRMRDLVLSADFMTGFPTEGEVEFAATEQMLGDLEIIYPHLFIYSPRPGTPAARFKREVP